MSVVETSIERAEVKAYRVPTQTPETDGTLGWDATEVVVVQLHAAGKRGLGYTYCHAAAASVAETLGQRLLGAPALSPMANHQLLLRSVRNWGRPGIAACAISAVDVALWDLKAKLLDLPLVSLLGSVRKRVPAYGSGGFTSWSDAELEACMQAWTELGLEQVKMKVGRDPHRDPDRVGRTRRAVGNRVGLFVDANGAYSVKQSLAMAERFAAFDVSWFEEPVSSDDLAGLRMVRERAPVGMDVTAGEYGYDLFYFRRMLEHGAVDVLQADATRCLGCTGFLGVETLCRAYDRPLSAHTAPTLHAHLACASPSVIHVEYFLDHVRLEQLFFDAPPVLVAGQLEPDRSRPGLGIELRHADIERFAI